MEKIILGPEDPTVFAKCVFCDKKGNGEKPGTYFGRAYTQRRWKRGQACENCGRSLVKLFEVAQND